MQECIELVTALTPMMKTGDTSNYWAAALGAGGAVAGALAAYIPNACIARKLRENQAKSTAFQLYAEINSTLELANKRGYRKGLEKVCAAMAPGAITSHSITVQVPDDRFIVFKANLSNIGLLPPALQTKIVMLYQIMESLVQDMKPGGFLNTPPGKKPEFDEALQLFVSAEELAKEVMAAFEKMYPELKQSHN